LRRVGREKPQGISLKRLQIVASTCTTLRLITVLTVRAAGRF
jgi:hypothetical protein